MGSSFVGAYPLSESFAQRGMQIEGFSNPSMSEGASFCQQEEQAGISTRNKSYPSFPSYGRAATEGKDYHELFASGAYPFRGSFGCASTRDTQIFDDNQHQPFSGVGQKIVEREKKKWNSFLDQVGMISPLSRNFSASKVKAKKSLFLKLYYQQQKVSFISRKVFTLMPSSNFPILDFPFEQWQLKKMSSSPISESLFYYGQLLVGAEQIEDLHTPKGVSTRSKSSMSSCPKEGREAVLRAKLSGCASTRKTSNICFFSCPSLVRSKSKICFAQEAYGQEGTEANPQCQSFERRGKTSPIRRKGKICLGQTVNRIYKRACSLKKKSFIRTTSLLRHARLPENKIWNSVSSFSSKRCEVDKKYGNDFSLVSKRSLLKKIISERKSGPHFPFELSCLSKSKLTTIVTSFMGSKLFANQSSKQWNFNAISYAYTSSSGEPCTSYQGYMHSNLRLLLGGAYPFRVSFGSNKSKSSMSVLPKVNNSSKSKKSVLPVLLPKDAKLMDRKDKKKSNHNFYAKQPFCFTSFLRLGRDAKHVLHLPYTPEIPYFVKSKRKTNMYETGIPTPLSGVALTSSMSEKKDRKRFNTEILCFVKKYNKFHTLPLFSTFVYKEWLHRFSFLEYFIWPVQNEDLTLPLYADQNDMNSSLDQKDYQTSRKNSVILVKNIFSSLTTPNKDQPVPTDRVSRGKNSAVSSLMQQKTSQLIKASKSHPFFTCILYKTSILPQMRKNKRDHVTPYTPLPFLGVATSINDEERGLLASQPILRMPGVSSSYYASESTMKSPLSVVASESKNAKQIFDGNPLVAKAQGQVMYMQNLISESSRRKTVTGSVASPKENGKNNTDISMKFTRGRVCEKDVSRSKKKKIGTSFTFEKNRTCEKVKRGTLFPAALGIQKLHFMQTHFYSPDTSFLPRAFHVFSRREMQRRALLCNVNGIGCGKQSMQIQSCLASERSVGWIEGEKHRKNNQIQRLRTFLSSLSFLSVEKIERTNIYTSPPVAGHYLSKSFLLTSKICSASLPSEGKVASRPQEGTEVNFRCLPFEGKDAKLSFGRRKDNGKEATVEVKKRTPFEDRIGHKERKPASLTNGSSYSLFSTIDTQQFPRLEELLRFTGGTALCSLLSRFDLTLLGKFLRHELKNLELKVNCLLSLKILTYSQGLLLGKLAKRRSKQIRRLKLLELFQSQKSNPEWMILSVLPVLPPDLRPILRVNDDFVVASDLNRLYQTVLRRNNTIHERLDDPLPCPESGLFRQRSLQKAVDGLLENGKGGGTPLCASKRRPLVSLSHVLKGKKGLFRQHLLGKRVDYSGRSVIVVGPRLHLHECGLPKEMAMELFQPFLLHRLKVKGLATSNTIARQMIQQEDPIIWHILKQLVYEHPVLLNRAPTLHRLGIQAFQPRLVSGRAILLHPLVCNGFNADFDGDQMAVHVPLSFQARAEAWKIMWSKNNVLSPATGQPILVPSQDMVLGCYYLSVSVPRVLSFLTPTTSIVDKTRETSTHFTKLSGPLTQMDYYAYQGKKLLLFHAPSCPEASVPSCPKASCAYPFRGMQIFDVNEGLTSKMSAATLPSESKQQKQILDLHTLKGVSTNKEHQSRGKNHIKNDRSKSYPFFWTSRASLLSKGKEATKVKQEMSLTEEKKVTFPYTPEGLLLGNIKNLPLVVSSNAEQLEDLHTPKGVSTRSKSSMSEGTPSYPFCPQKEQKGSGVRTKSKSYPSFSSEGKDLHQRFASVPSDVKQIFEDRNLFQSTSLLLSPSSCKTTLDITVATTIKDVNKIYSKHIPCFLSESSGRRRATKGESILSYFPSRPKASCAKQIFDLIRTNEELTSKTCPEASNIFDVFLVLAQPESFARKTDIEDLLLTSSMSTKSCPLAAEAQGLTSKMLEATDVNQKQRTGMMKEDMKGNTFLNLNKGHYFSNLQDSLLAYFQGRLQTHTPFWVRINSSTNFTGNTPASNVKTFLNEDILQSSKKTPFLLENFFNNPLSLKDNSRKVFFTPLVLTQPKDAKLLDRLKTSKSDKPERTKLLNWKKLSNEKTTLTQTIFEGKSPTYPLRPSSKRQLRVLRAKLSDMKTSKVCFASLPFGNYPLSDSVGRKGMQLEGFSNPLMSTKGTEAFGQEAIHEGLQTCLTNGNQRPFTGALSKFIDTSSSYVVNSRKLTFLQPRYGSSREMCQTVFQTYYFQTQLIIEGNETLESPLELRLGVDGNLAKILTTFQNHYSSNVTLIEQYKENCVKYMRTTAGRVVINKAIF